ncbi:MAG TPA: type II secretion system F family protein [Thermoanaerobaculia bacterium]|jgi:type IV pilus assembly protein PilC|nr:type II secretion system F family protein [Thermoanaerobaculia bacterium]
MPSYAWKGRNRAGMVQEGAMVAESKELALAQLRRQNIVVTGIRERGKEISLSKVGRKVPPKTLAVFTRQFSVMIDAGLPLVQCLEILALQQEHKNFQKILLQVRQDVEAGSTLADAMRRHPKAFDTLYVNMIAAGEAGGILDTILQRLSVYIEKAVKLRSQVRSALIYPVAVIVIAAIVVAVILLKVIPTFAALFTSLGAELPFPTRVVIASSNFLARYFIFFVVGIGVFAYAIRRYYRTYRGRRVIDGFLLKLPILGMILRKIAVARFCRTLATLTSSGVPILESLDITARTAGNAIVEDAVLETRKSVEGGKTIVEPLKDSNVFPNMVVQMIGVGEQTGALDAMLNKIADFYEDEVDAAVQGLVKLMEPVMIFILGIIIGGIVIAMYLPMFTLINKIG